VENSLCSTETVREALREEYFKVIDILQGYDPYFLSIKNWGVTAIGLAATIGLANKAPIVFLLISFIAVGFWLTEVRFKLLQLGHTLRATELEQALREPKPGEYGPRILAAFGEESRRNLQMGRWRSVLLWPQVMFPHVVFVVAGPVVYLAVCLFP
jgi:hypothetical protein